MRKKVLFIFLLLVPFIILALSTGDVNGDGKVSNLVYFKIIEIIIDLSERQDLVNIINYVKINWQ